MRTQVEADEIAVLGLALVARLAIGHSLQLLAVDGIDDAAALGMCRKMPSSGGAFPRQALDRLGLVAIARDVWALQPRQPRQDAVALPERRLAAAPARRAAPAHERARALALGRVPDRGLGDQVAVGIAGDDLQHRHRRQAGRAP